MKHLFLLITEHTGQQNFLGKVRANSQNVNIVYNNDNPISVKILNVTNNHQGLLNKVVDVVLTSENPVEENLVGYVTEEADIIQYIN